MSYRSKRRLSPFSIRMGKLTLLFGLHALSEYLLHALDTPLVSMAIQCWWWIWCDRGLGIYSFLRAHLRIGSFLEGVIYGMLLPLSSPPSSSEWEGLITRAWVYAAFAVALVCGIQHLGLVWHWWSRVTYSAKGSAHCLNTDHLKAHSWAFSLEPQSWHVHLLGP